VNEGTDSTCRGCPNTLVCTAGKQHTITRYFCDVCRGSFVYVSEEKRYRPCLGIRGMPSFLPFMCPTCEVYRTEYLGGRRGTAH
jgi:hypothetical protein